MTTKTPLSSNIFLFSGEDNFSLQRKLNQWKVEFAKKYSASAVTVIEAGEWSQSVIIGNLQTHFSPSLFASKKLIIVHDGLPTKAAQETLAEFLLSSIEQVSKDYFVIFWQSRKPDGRLSFTKKFTAKVTVTEFDLPHGMVLNQWIKAMAKTLGAEISDRAVDKLAVFLGRDLYEEKKMAGRVIERKEAFDLWEVHSELLKLTSFNNQIDVQDVESLVKAKVPDSVFALTDQVIAKNTKQSLVAFENFLSTQTADEKTSLIKIIGLLSEQLRSLLLVSMLQKQSLDNEQIAEKLGWTSGRVFITARNSRNISEEKLKKLLSKLLLIDSHIKSADTNEKLDLNLFLIQATT